MDSLSSNNSFIKQPGTTVRIPLNLAPAPFLPDGLYNNEDNNLVRITTNTDTCPLQLRNNQPILGVTVQLLNHEDNRKTPKLNKLLQADSPNRKTKAYHNDPTRKKHESATNKIQHDHNIGADHPRTKPSLETKEPNIPGIGDKSTEKTPLETDNIRRDRFDTKDIEQVQIHANKQLIVKITTHIC